MVTIHTFSKYTDLCVCFANLRCDARAIVYVCFCVCVVAKNERMISTVLKIV